jgi:hypothetical protein
MLLREISGIESISTNDWLMFLIPYAEAFCSGPRHACCAVMKKRRAVEKSPAFLCLTTPTVL